MITMALPTGRLGKQAIEMLKASMTGLEELESSSRRLIYQIDDLKIRFIMVKPTDVPTYVEYGAADVGIAGKDTLLEEGKQLYEMLDLGFGKCKMAVAGYPDKKNLWASKPHIKVATKYPNIANDYFSKLGSTVEIIKLNGSVELGPLVGLSDVIVDIVESGRTLRDNGLVVLEEISDISARLVVNRVSLKTQNGLVTGLINSMEKTLEEEKNDR